MIDFCNSISRGVVSAIFLGFLALPLGAANRPTPPPSLSPRSSAKINLHGPSSWPAEIDRVLVLPAHDTTRTLGEMGLAQLDRIWLEKLHASQRAEFVEITRERLQRSVQVDSLNSTDPLPPDWWSRLSRETGAHAVVMLDLTHIRSYGDLAIGVRAKLVRLSDADILWMIDEVFDSRDPSVAEAARTFTRPSRGARKIGDSSIAIRQSPSLFATYAFDAALHHLPLRVLHQKSKIAAKDR